MASEAASSAKTDRASSVSEAVEALFQSSSADNVLVAIDYYCRHNWGGPGAHYATDPIYRLHCKIDYRPAPSNRRGVEDECEDVQDVYREIEARMSGKHPWPLEVLEACVDRCQAAIRRVNGE